MPYLYHLVALYLLLIFTMGIMGIIFSGKHIRQNTPCDKHLQGVGIFSREEVSLANDSEIDFKD